MITTPAILLLNHRSLRTYCVRSILADIRFLQNDSDFGCRCPITITTIILYCGSGINFISWYLEGIFNINLISRYLEGIFKNG